MKSKTTHYIIFTCKMTLEGQNGLCVKYVDWNCEQLLGLIENWYLGIFKVVDFESTKFKKSKWWIQYSRRNWYSGEIGD